MTGFQIIEWDNIVCRPLGERIIHVERDIGKQLMSTSGWLAFQIGTEFNI
ncbi:hypothetical protein [Rubripirellula reticaptiva]|nr:hypothetical protein [Rubripirellula reticaptiva]